MTDGIYDDLALEQIIKKQFGLQLELGSVIVRNVPVGRTTNATVFLTTKKQLYAFIDGEAKLLLSDIKKIINRMGMVAELYLPPKGQPNYFDEIGASKFREVFPGRNNPSADDIRYYRTLAQYKPALVQILEVTDSEIYQYDVDTHGGWRPAAKFAYRRIRTS